MAVSWLAAAAALLVLAAAAFWGGAALRTVVAPTGATAFAAEAEQPTYPGPEAYAEKIVLDDQEQGIVVLGANQPLRIRTSAGGFTGYERAMVVVNRLNSRLAAGLQGEQIQAEQYNGEWVVTGAGNNLITVNQAEADIRDLTRQQLSDIWSANLRVAVDVAWQTPPPAETEPAEGEAAEEEPAEQPADEEAVEQELAEQPAEEATEAAITEEPEGWQPEEPYKDKIVAIVSFGEGARLGIARINGPQSAVDQVQAVAQLETSYKDHLDIEIYVPISTKVPGRILDRVQGVGVTGVGDLRIR
jgi:hypothetical protein